MNFTEALRIAVNNEGVKIRMTNWDRGIYDFCRDGLIHNQDGDLALFGKQHLDGIWEVLEEKEKAIGLYGCPSTHLKEVQRKYSPQSAGSVEMTKILGRILDEHYEAIKRIESYSTKTVESKSSKPFGEAYPGMKY